MGDPCLKARTLRIQFAPQPGCPASTPVETHSDALSNLQLHLIVWLPRVQFENEDSKGSKQTREARGLEKRRNETGTPASAGSPTRVLSASTTKLEAVQHGLESRNPRLIPDLGETFTTIEYDVSSGFTYPPCMALSEVPESFVLIGSSILSNAFFLYLLR